MLERNETYHKNSPYIGILNIYFKNFITNIHNTIIIIEIDDNTFYLSVIIEKSVWALGIHYKLYYDIVHYFVFSKFKKFDDFNWFCFFAQTRYLERVGDCVYIDNSFT